MIHNITGQDSSVYKAVFIDSGHLDIAAYPALAIAVSISGHIGSGRIDKLRYAQRCCIIGAGD